MSFMPVSGSSGDSSSSVRLAALWQSGAGLIGMVPAYLYFDIKVALGIGFGVMIAMVSTMLLARRIAGAAGTDPEQGQRLLYAGAAVRFVFVLMALVVAYKLDLHLLAVAGGMLLAQAAMFVFAVRGFRHQAGRHTV
ncbi:MAG: ATP synthase subunit I [Mariprofundaceae bacterium]|nr:ATP synthase subunit I [Mariprofundaceae bacterium]